MKKLLIFTGLALAAVLSAREPSMKVIEKKIDRKGVSLTQKEWKVNFHHSEMLLKNMIGADGKLVKKAWGDFFCGLTHGTISNGSWDIWDFISVQSMKWKNIPSAAPVSNVAFVRFPDSSSFNMSWADGEIKVLQTSGAKDWVYVKVKMPAGIRCVTLRLRPGGAHSSVKGRERHIRYNGGDELAEFFKVKTLKWDGKSDGLAFYNRNYSEKNGNFLVFESEKIAKINHHTENPVTLQIYPKKGVTEMNFALGYFLNANADEVTKRFLVEQLPNQRKALDSIEWDKAPDFTEFSRNAEQVKKLIAGLQGDEKAKNEKELAAIQKEYEAAKAMNDQNAYAKALDKLRKLQKAIGSSALNSLM